MLPAVSACQTGQETTASGKQVKKRKKRHLLRQRFFA
jgi:hypothetical protein